MRNDWFHPQDLASLKFYSLRMQGVIPSERTRNLDPSFKMDLDFLAGFGRKAPEIKIHLLRWL